MFTKCVMIGNFVFLSAASAPPGICRDCPSDVCVSATAHGHHQVDHGQVHQLSQEKERTKEGSLGQPPRTHGRIWWWLSLQWCYPCINIWVLMFHYLTETHCCLLFSNGITRIIDHFLVGQSLLYSVNTTFHRYRAHPKKSAMFAIWTGQEIGTLTCHWVIKTLIVIRNVQTCTN